MKHVQFVVAAVATSVTLISIAALAAAPPECSGPRTRTYEMAYDSRTNLLNTLFRRTYDCNSLEVFTARARRMLLLSTFADHCQSAGVQDATNDTLDRLATQCLSIAPGHSAEGVGGLSSAAEATSCEQMGREAGNYAAELYCNPGTGITSPPVYHLCPSISRYACEREFYRVISQDPQCKQQARSDPGLAEVLSAACTPT